MKEKRAPDSKIAVHSSIIESGVNGIMNMFSDMKLAPEVAIFICDETRRFVMKAYGIKEIEVEGRCEKTGKKLECKIDRPDMI